MHETNLEIKDIEGNKPLESANVADLLYDAIEYRRWSLVKELLKNKDLDVNHNFVSTGNTSLHFLALTEIFSDPPLTGQEPIFTELYKA